MLTTDAAYHFAGDGLVRITHHWRLLSDVSLALEHARIRVYVSTCIRAILKACLPEVFDRCLFKRECPLGPSHIANMWHMIKKSKFFIFGPEIAYSKPRNVVGFVFFK